MKVYWTVCILTLLISWAMPYCTEPQCKKRMIFSFLPLFLFGALRVDFGNDYSVYEAFWESMHMGQFSFDTTLHEELGFQLLNYLMPSFRALLVLNSLILCIALGVFLYKNVPPQYLWVALLLMFLNPEKNIYGSLVGIRNGLAISGFLLSFVYIQERKFKAFIVSTIVLSLFHTSALLYMPVAYFVANNRELKLEEIILWSIALLVLLAFSVSKLIELITPLISAYFYRYEVYLESETHRGFLLIITNIIFFIIICCGVYSNRYEFSYKQNSLFRMGLVYLGSAFLGSLSMRASYFYDMFFVATIATLCSMRWEKPLLKWILLGLSFIVSIYSTFVLWMGSEWWDHEIYHSILKLI